MSAEPAIIGFAGYKRSGKNAIGERVARVKRLNTTSIAAAIRDEVCLRYGIPPISDEDKDRPLNEVLDDKRLAGFAVGEVRLTYRDLLIHHGMQRRAQDENYWIKRVNDLMRREVDQENACGHVITDVRLPIEIKWIQDNGGVVFWIRRDSARGNDHVTEQDQSALCDAIVDNNGTPERAVDEVISFMDRPSKDILPADVIIDAGSAKPRVRLRDLLREHMSPQGD